MKLNRWVTSLTSPQGNHGHRLNEEISSILLSQLIGGKYYHTSNKINDILKFSGIHHCSSELPKTISKIIIEGQEVGRDRLDNGLKEETLNNIININNQSENVLFILDSRQPHKAINIYPHQIFNKDFLKNAMSKLREGFLLEHPNSPIRKEINIHINRGQDWNHPRYKKNINASQYQFPISYWINLLNCISNCNFKNLDINIFTEKLNSEELVSHLSDIKNVKIHLGPNRQEKKHDVIRGIWKRFVLGSHLVVAHSAFSTSCFYFRGDAPLLYHPHARFKNLPSNCLKINDSGYVNQKDLKLFYE